MNTQSKTTSKPGSGSLDVFQVADLEFCIQGQNLYYLFAFELRPNRYQVILSVIDEGPGSRVIFDQQLFTTELYAARRKYVADTLLEILSRLDASNIDDPYLLPLWFGGVSKHNPLKLPTRSR